MRKHNIQKRIIALAAMFLGILLVSACTGTTEHIEVTEQTVILDVRTPQEFNDGHLPDAINLDWNAGQLQAELPNLDPTKKYLVYCKSGNRAGQAIKAMKNAGITQTLNLGSLQKASETLALTIIE